MVAIARRGSAASSRKTVASTSHGWRGWSRSIQAAGSGAQCVHLHLGHTLQPGDALQLQIQGVHHYPSKHVRHIENHPDEEHEDVVGGGAAGHVIDDGSINPSNDLPWGEKPHSPKPSLKAPLLFQPQSVKDDAGCDEEGNCANNGSEPGEEEKVTDMMVADVDEIEAEEVVPSVAGARLGLLQQVAVKERGDAGPGREGEGVEGDVPGGCGEIGIAGTSDKGPPPPRHPRGFQADPT